MTKVRTTISTIVLSFTSLLMACAAHTDDGNTDDESEGQADAGDLESMEDTTGSVGDDRALAQKTTPCGGCCGEACCLKGGSWEDRNGMRMCCRTDADGSKACISDPTAWPNSLPTDSDESPWPIEPRTLPPLERQH